MRSRVLAVVAAALVAVAVALGVVVATRSWGDGQPPSPPRRQGTPVQRCEEKIGTVAAKPQWDAPPAMQIDRQRRYEARMQTTLGTIIIDLDPVSAPVTVNNFMFLAKCGFYDGIIFHRVARNFVVQAGDPTGTGRGGPGYTFADELPPLRGYDVGAVAMANSGPNTNGSQFFIVTGTNGGSLPNNYSTFGRVVQGLDVAQSIERLQTEGGRADGRPEDPPSITSIEIVER